MATLTVSKEEEKRLKGMGFLSNKGTDNFSARVITVNGKVTAAQQRCLAEAAEKYGNGILTFTTRQTVRCRASPMKILRHFRNIWQRKVWKQEEPVHWYVRLYPVKEPPASMDFWIPSHSPRKFTNVSTKDTALTSFRTNLKLQWADVPTTV